jgi:hypothetical protein
MKQEKAIAIPNDFLKILTIELIKAPDDFFKKMPRKEEGSVQTPLIANKL